MHVSETFGGLYTVDKNFDAHAFAVSSANARLERMWGKDRPHMLCDFEGEPPKYTVSVWMVGPEKDPEDHGTHLFVTWFVDHIPEDPLWSALIRINQRGGWEKNAVGFEY